VKIKFGNWEIEIDIFVLVVAAICTCVLAGIIFFN